MSAAAAHAASKTPVSKRALLARINRKLGPELRAHEHRQTMGWIKRGTFFLVRNSEAILDMGVDLEVLGATVGALRENETVEGVAEGRSLLAVDLAQNLHARADQIERARHRRSRAART